MTEIMTIRELIDRLERYEEAHEEDVLVLKGELVGKFTITVDEKIDGIKLSGSQSWNLDAFKTHDTRNVSESNHALNHIMLVDRDRLSQNVLDRLKEEK